MQEKQKLLTPSLIELKLNKDLRQVFSIEIDKKIIQEKLNERLLQLQSEVNLKGFRPGKVPANVIKNQFGKAIYGEVIDKILKDSSSKVLNEKKIIHNYYNISK